MSSAPAPAVAVESAADPGPLPGGGPMGQVMLAFETTLRSFLETQKVILRCLADWQSGPVEGSAAPGTSAIVSPDRADREGGPPRSTATPTASPSTGNEPPAGKATWQRYVLERVQAPLCPGRAGLVTGGVILVTDDGTGVAHALAAEFRALGHQVVRVRQRGSQGQEEVVDLASESAVASLVERARRLGDLAAIIHALPLRHAEPTGLDPTAWDDRMGPELRGLFLLAHAASDDLTRSAMRGGSCLIAATALGGGLGRGDPAFEPVFPGQAAVAGLVKSLAREWSGVRVRVVDSDPAIEPEVIAAHLVHEVYSEDHRTEVGYAGGVRGALGSVPCPLNDRDGPGGIELLPGEPLLVTGATHPRVASVVQHLTRLWRPTLLLIGTDPAPAEVEGPDTAGCLHPGTLRATLAERLRRARPGLPVRPALVTRAYLALSRERAIRAHLRACREAGSTVEYRAVDVRDLDALGLILADWRRRHGPLAGLIHGAGAGEDVPVRDLSLVAFSHGLGTRLHGARNLARCLDSEAATLRFAIFLASLSGRLGGRGQASDAAASEGLTSLARWLDRRWPGRALTLLSSPDPAEVSSNSSSASSSPFAALVAEELRLGRKGETEILLASDPQPLDEPPAGEAHSYG